MTKTFRLVNLDCANCAAKMERKINKINGVNSASINFMALKMTIDMEDEAAIMDEVLKAMKSVESDVSIRA